jgi:hypothetical protein
MPWATGRVAWAKAAGALAVAHKAAPQISPAGKPRTMVVPIAPIASGLPVDA